MRNFRIIMIVLAAGMIVFWLFSVDFENFISKSNRQPLGSILAMIILIFGLIYSINYDRKKEERSKE